MSPIEKANVYWHDTSGIGSTLVMIGVRDMPNTDVSIARVLQTDDNQWYVYVNGVELGQKFSFREEAKLWLMNALFPFSKARKLKKEEATISTTDSLEDLILN